MAAIPPLTGPFGQLIAFGVGSATGPLLRPPIQDLINEAWTLHPVRPPDALTLAQGVAQGQVDPAWARARAAENGISGDAFQRLIDVANTGPGMAQAFNLWRRGQLDQAGFRRALRRLGIEQEWIDALWAVRQDILDPAQLAVMVQRGVIPDPGLLPVGPPTAVGKVTPMPVANIDTLLEAAGSGIDKERLAAMTRIIGLPASPDLAARMVFRQIIDRVDFDRAIAEGNTRNEWADFLFDGFREIPSARDFIQGRLRAWITDAEMRAGTAKHGMSAADTDLLFKIQGRPLSFHQVFIGERRGGTYGVDNAGIDPAFLKSLQESNIRPEWYQLAWAQRHTYPSAFVLRALVQSGDLTQAEGYDILLRIGWPEALAQTVSERWAGGAGATSDPHVTKAENQLWTTTHRSYIASESNDADAEARFTLLGVAAAAQPAILALWQSERELIRKQLTPAQIKKAYAKLTRNYATGQPWTRDDAIAALVARGYSVTEANDFLDI